MTRQHKKCLVLNSHSLSSYQACPEAYHLGTVQNLESREFYKPFRRGSAIAEIMEVYYKAVRDKCLTAKLVLELAETVFVNAPELEMADKNLIVTRFLQYYKFYQNCTWQPIAMEVEAAFSRIIHEDEKYIFIYEGRPDLVVRLSNRDSTILVVDHKMQSRKTELYHHTNQGKGYCWALGARFFVYNIFGFIETGKPADWFRRPSTSFSPEQIELWKQDTIKWYYKIAEDEEYQRSWQCEKKYGLCSFHKLCEQAHLPNVVQGIKERLYKPREYQSW